MKLNKNKSTILWLSRVVGGNKILILFLLIVQIIISASSVVYALLIRNVINSAVAHDRHGFFSAIFLFIALLAVQIAMRALNRYLDELTRAKIENAFKAKLFDGLLTKEYKNVSATHSAEWINRLTSDTSIIADGLTHIIPGVSGMLVMMIGAMAMIVMMEPKFSYIIIPGGILLVIFSYVFRKNLKQLHKNVQVQDGKLKSIFQEMLESMIVIRTFAVEGMVEEKVNTQMDEHKKARMKKNHFFNICNIGFAIMMNGMYLLGVLYCGYGILIDTVTYGTFTAIMQLIGYVQSPFANISGYASKFFAMLASAERIMEVEELKDSNDIEPHSMKEVVDFYSNKFRSIGIRDGIFAYNEENDGGEYVINGINFEINKGEYTAFVGPSGSGKSTVLKLMLSVYELNSGCIYLCTEGGNQIFDRSWQKLFAYVPQGNHLMSGSIREIIAFADMANMHDDARMIKALRVACADEFISELDDGLDTMLGEHGAGLSEGQMQRIAIARAIFSNAPILMLDEATSALDDATEEKLLNNLRNMTDKTVLIITHRPAALKICDKVIEITDSKCSVANGE